MSYWQVMELVGAVAEKARIAGFGMVEFMPERDIDEMGALTAAQLLAGVLGIIARDR
jgi:agmatinase